MKQWEQAGQGTTVQLASMGVGVKSLPEPLVRGLLTIPDVEVKEICRAAEGLVEAGAPGEGKVENVVFTLAFLVRGVAAEGKRGIVLQAREDWPPGDVRGLLVASGLSGELWPGLHAFSPLNAEILAI